MQDLAYRTILSGLKAGGIVTGEVDDMMKANIGALFMPHGEQAALRCGTSP